MVVTHCSIARELPVAVFIYEEKEDADPADLTLPKPSRTASRARVKAEASSRVDFARISCKI